MVRRLVVPLLCGWMLLDALPASAQEQRPRTLIEAIDASAPQAAALAFVGAFSRSDYFAAAFLLTFEAKLGFASGVQTRAGVRRLFPDSDGVVPGAAIFQTDGRFIEEQSLDFAMLFDDLMIHAERADLLPFRISPDTDIALTTGDAGPDHGRATAVLADGVTLHLVQKTADLWLIDRISYPGSVEGNRPWQGSGD